MHAHFIIDTLFKFSVVFGFAYIVWTIASREVAGVKVTGQIIAAAIVILVLAASLFMPHHHWNNMDKNTDAQMDKGTQTTDVTQKTEGKWHHTGAGKHLKKHSTSSTDNTDAK